MLLLLSCANLWSLPCMAICNYVFFFRPCRRCLQTPSRGCRCTTKLLWRTTKWAKRLTTGVYPAKSPLICATIRLPNENILQGLVLQALQAVKPPEYLCIPMSSSTKADGHGCSHHWQSVLLHFSFSGSMLFSFPVVFFWVRYKKIIQMGDSYSTNHL